MGLALELRQALQNCEKDFLRSADLARGLQKNVRPEMKSQTGNLVTDIVTQADLEVQEAVLRALPPLVLEHCHVLAEERTAFLVDRREPEPASFYLTLDPVDGTKRFAEGSNYYSLIVGLHDGRQPLYTFVYYPNLNWWIRLTDVALESGPAPSLGDLGDLSRTIVYTAGNPFVQHPEWVAAAAAEGYRFEKGDALGPWGSKFLLLSGYAGGYYVDTPNAYDGMFGYHYARSRGYGLLGEVRLDSPQPTPRGACYPGAYFAIREGLQAGGPEI